MIVESYINVIRAFVSSIGLCCVFFTQAQITDKSFEKIQRQNEVEEFVWSETDTYESMLSPEASQFPDDDAVYLKRFRYITTQKPSKKFRVWRLDRQVVLIQKKQAIEDFATLEIEDIRLKGRFVDVAVRILKKDGTIIHIRREDFIEEGNGVKVAIPGIEVGDILDYYSFERTERYVIDYKTYDPSVIYFASVYPVVDHYCEFNLKTGGFFKFMRLNDAPDVKVLSQGELDTYLRARVVIQDKMRPAYDVDSRWVNPLEEYPAVRYALAVGSPTETESLANLIDKRDKASTETTDEMILAMVAELSKQDIDFYKMSKKDRKSIVADALSEGGASKRKTVEAFYEGLLGKTFLRGSTYGWNDWRVVREVGKFCREQGVSSDWLYVMPRALGDARKMLVQDDAVRVLRMNFDDGPVYMRAGHGYIPFGFYNAYLEGSEAFVVANKEDAYKSPAIKIENIPFSDAEQNREVSKLDLSMEEDVLKGTYQIEYFGHTSIGTIRDYDESRMTLYDLAMFLPQREYVKKMVESGEFDGDDETYIIEDIRSIKRVDDVDMSDMSWKEIQTVKSKADHATYQNWMLDATMGELKNRFGEDRIEEVEEMTLLHDGLSSDGKGLAYSCPIELKDFFKSLGSNKIIQIGQLIGEQARFQQDQRERDSDIYMAYPRQYVNTINLKVPTDYTIEGLEAINVNVDNASGTFRSVATVNDGLLTIETTKTYKTAGEKAEHWQRMLEFLDAAYDFTQKELLLKKR